MSNFIPTLMADFYKLSHRVQYPEGTTTVYSTWTPRSFKHMPSIDQVVVFGNQGFISEYLVDYFNDNFFSENKECIVQQYSRVVKNCLGVPNPDTSHIEKLWDLGYLPLEIKGLPEGSLVEEKVPTLTVKNTHPDFFWLTNYIETLMSCELWQSYTSATLAFQYKEILECYRRLTGGEEQGVMFQGHDFSMRGMGGINAAAKSGAGHLLSFWGTDTIPAIMYLEQYYGADVEKEMVGCSVPATEHSVMCAGGKQDERETIKRLITETYPEGIISVVSDTWDLWKVVDETLPSLKEEIMSRPGKLVIRPDSGDPADILCGTKETKGLIERLADTFGTTTNDLGYKELDPHIGAIYGDAITPGKCSEICRRLRRKGFASSNVVFGIGSFTYQYNTRDSFGFAMKSTLCVINGEERQIFKDPITDDGVKKSATGAVKVTKEGYNFVLTDKLSLEESEEGELKTIFINGVVQNLTTLSEIRGRINDRLLR